MIVVKAIAHFETILVDAIDKDSTTMVLDSIVTPAGNLPAGTYGFVLEQESNSKREYIIGTLSGSTVTFITRDVSPLDAETANSSADDQRKSHRKGASIKLSNFPVLTQLARILSGDEDLDSTTPIVLSGSRTPTSANELVTKEWVESVVNGGEVFYETQIVRGDGGEVISAAGKLLYLKETDGEWYLVNTANTDWYGKQLGISQGAGTDGNPIAGGVLVSGLDDSISYTLGQLYYGTDVAGVIGTSAGTKELKIGVGDANNKLFFFGNAYRLTDDEKDALAGTSGTPSATNKFVTNNSIEGFGSGADGDFVLDGTNTYAKLSKSSNEYTMTEDIYADDFEVQSGKTLITDGFKLFVNGTLSGAGTIKWGTPNAGATPSTASGDTGGSGGTGAAAGGTGYLKNIAGSAGGAGGNANSSGTAGVAGAAANPSRGAAGGAGGAGGTNANGTAGAAGAAGAVTADIYSFAKQIWATYDLIGMKTDGTLAMLKAAAGAGGGGGGVGGDGGTSAGGAGGGGGAGASGGIILIAARTWAGTFTISNIGGAGAAGGLSAGGGAGIDPASGGGGGGGAGGCTIVVYQTKTWSGSHTLTGGAAGAGGAAVNSGAAGSNGNAGTTGTSVEIDISNLLT